MCSGPGYTFSGRCPSLAANLNDLFNFIEFLERLGASIGMDALADVPEASAPQTV